MIKTKTWTGICALSAALTLLSFYYIKRDKNLEKNIQKNNITEDILKKFNTKDDQLIYLFNKPSDITVDEFTESPAFKLLSQMPLFSSDNKIISMNLQNQIWFDSLSKNDKDLIINLNNFDEKTFYEITGINIDNELLNNKSEDYNETSNDDLNIEQLPFCNDLLIDSCDDNNISF